MDIYYKTCDKEYIDKMFLITECHECRSEKINYRVKDVIIEYIGKDRIKHISFGDPVATCSNCMTILFGN